MIIFNEPLLLGTEQEYLNKVLDNGYFCGNGIFAGLCEDELARIFQAERVLITSSATAAMSVAVELLAIEPGDEIILPSFAHVGTASAFASHQANLIWCDINPITRILDENNLENLITNRTKAVIIVNYAGAASNITTIKEICDRHSLLLIEDNAPGIGASYQNRPLGSFGEMSVVSFHQTKNVHCGEGGALIINSPRFCEDAQKIRDRGTDRKDFDEGKIKCWTWQTSGSNYFISEFQAAFLYAQLQELEKVNKHRIALYHRYLNLLKENLPPACLPRINPSSSHNGHCFSILTEGEIHRADIIERLHQSGVQSAFHYQPLHKAPYWHGRYDKLKLPATEKVAQSILRLPMHYNLKPEDVDYICERVSVAFSSGK